ncbi:hypothetical protein K9M59_01470 [Candidatus Gracilibacteria bacterium]|nr:hypothetical protein [Candidatus Gracilibacteria bacterium]MCF7819796.1 hypothetical protein [Candidatus Gracilibacteria bacterium]
MEKKQAEVIEKILEESDLPEVLAFVSPQKIAEFHEFQKQKKEEIKRTIQEKNNQ